MPPRSHEAGEPLPDDPEGPTDEPTAPPPDDGSGPDDDGLGADDVDAQWADIVTHLQGPSDPRSWAPDPDVAEAEDHFVPPEPGPVFGGNPLLTMAWCAVIGMPLLLLVVAIAWPGIPRWLLEVGGVAFLAGVGVLVWRMPQDREDDAGPGAVV